MKKLYCISGWSGSGKTTYAKSLGLKYHFEADDYFLIDGVYCFVPSYIGAAHAYCLAKTEHAMKTGEDIVVANTFTRKWEREPYYKLAEQYGYSVEFKVMTGNYKNVHNVPDVVVEKQKARFEY